MKLLCGKANVKNLAVTTGIIIGMLLFYIEQSTIPQRTTTSTKGICSAREVTQTNLLAIACAAGS
jgi:hypothetical protein